MYIILYEQHNSEQEKLMISKWRKFFPHENSEVETLKYKTLAAFYPPSPLLVFGINHTRGVTLPLILRDNANSGTFKMENDAPYVIL